MSSDRPAEPPDSRSLQANERTLLAWMRTALAFISFGFGFAQLDAWLTRAGHGRPRGTVVIASVFVLLGVVGETLALVRYHRIRQALLARREVPLQPLAPVAFGLITALLGLVLAVYILR